MRRVRLSPVLVVLALLALLLPAPGAAVAVDPGRTVEVAPTRSLDVGALATGTRVRGVLEVTNPGTRPTRVRLGPLSTPAAPQPTRLRLSRDGVVLWSGGLHRLRQRPLLPGALAPGRTWRLRVTASVRPAEVEVAGVQATRDGTGAGPRDDLAAPRAGDGTAGEVVGESGDAVLAVGALDPAGHRISLRVQLVCSLLLAGGLLWIAAAFRVEARRRRRP